MTATHFAGSNLSYSSNVVSQEVQRVFARRAAADVRHFGPVAVLERRRASKISWQYRSTFLSKS